MSIYQTHVLVAFGLWSALGTSVRPGIQSC